MGQSPFAKRGAPISPPAERRHSTHLKAVVPIIISGRDASGQSFREATETFSVSFHGAALKTRNQIQIGMQLTVENLRADRADTVGKAICVRVAQAEGGKEPHAIAIQLLVPANIWAIKDPPADWKPRIEGTPEAAPPARSVSTSAPVTAPSTHAPATTARPAASPDLEQRSADLAESVLQLLRGQAAGMLRESLKEFEERLKFLESGAEARIIQKAEKSIADIEVALAKLRRELLDQLTARTERAILSAESAVKEKIASLMKTSAEPSAEPAEKNAEDESEHSNASD